jgi:hypothetical protein
MSPSFRSLHVSQSEATLRGPTETDHRQDLIFQLQKRKVVGLRAAVEARTRYLTLYANVLSIARPARLNVRQRRPPRKWAAVRTTS